MSTRPRRSCVKATAEKDVSVVQLSSDSDSDDDSTPPVLEMESPIQEEKKEEVAGNLATVLQNCLGTQNEETVKVVEDPFPKDINLLQLLKPVVVTPRVPLAAVPRTFQVFHATRDGREQHRDPQRYLPAQIATMAPTSFMVGSNTDKGPLRVLENRKREMERSGMAPAAKKPCPPLEAYNGGRPGVRFGRAPMPPRPSPATPQIEKNSENQQKKVFKDRQNETFSQIMNESSDDSVLLGTMVLNGLNTLNDRGGEEYGDFSKELFELIMKYNIQ